MTVLRTPDGSSTPPRALTAFSFRVFCGRLLFPPSVQMTAGERDDGLTRSGSAAIGASSCGFALR